MKNRTVAVLAVILLAFTAGPTATAAASPPATAAAAPGCPEDWMCFHDTSTSNPFLPIDVYDTVLNQCITGIQPATSYITNNTNFRWYVSNSTNCAHPRGTIYPNSQGPMGTGWNNSIRSAFRTSSTSAPAAGATGAVTP